jgi:hypothetical protein
MITGLISNITGLAVTRFEIVLQEDETWAPELDFSLLSSDDMAVAMNREVHISPRAEVLAAVEVLVSLLEQELAEGLFANSVSGKQDPELMEDTTGFFEHENTVTPQEG